MPGWALTTQQRLELSTASFPPAFTKEQIAQAAGVYKGNETRINVLYEIQFFSMVTCLRNKHHTCMFGLF